MNFNTVTKLYVSGIILVFIQPVPDALFKMEERKAVETRTSILKGNYFLFGCVAFVSIALMVLMVIYMRKSKKTLSDKKVCESSRDSDSEVQEYMQDSTISESTNDQEMDINSQDNNISTESETAIFSRQTSFSNSSDLGKRHSNIGTNESRSLYRGVSPKFQNQPRTNNSSSLGIESNFPNVTPHFMTYGAQQDGSMVLEAMLQKARTQLQSSAKEILLLRSEVDKERLKCKRAEEEVALVQSGNVQLVILQQGLEKTLENLKFKLSETEELLKNSWQVSKIQQLETELVEVKSQLQRTEENLQRTSEQIQEKNNIEIGMDKEINLLIEEQRHQNDNVNALAKENADLRKTLQLLDIQNKELNEASVLLTVEKQDIINQLNIVKAKNQKIVHHIGNFEKKQQIDAKVIEDLTANKHVIIEEMEETRIKWHSTRQELDLLKANFEEKAEELVLVNKENVDLRNQLAKISKNITLLERDKQNVSDGRDQACEDLKKEKANLHILNLELTFVTNEKERTAAELSLAKEKLQELSDEITKGNTKLREVTEDLNLANDDKQRLTYDFTFLNKDKNRLNDEVTKLLERNEELSNDMQEMEKQLQSVLKEKIEMARELHLLQIEIQQVHKEQKHLQDEEVSHVSNEKKEKEENLRTRIETHQSAVDTKAVQVDLHTHTEKVCIMCVNQSKLRSVAYCLLNMKLLEQIPFEVHMTMKRLSGILSISKDDFCEAGMVILVGIAEPRHMLISETEPSQLGVVYREAIRLNKHVFMVYVDDKYPDSLKSNQAFHQSLKTLFENQKAVGDLAEKNRFISVKYKEKDRFQKLNGMQCGLISNWITESCNP